MAAYAVIDVLVKDPERYKEYMRQGAPTILKYGGRPLVRGGKVEVMEGDWQPRRVIIIEFQDMPALKRWWNSPEYAEAKKLRLGAAEANVAFVEGIE